MSAEIEVAKALLKAGNIAGAEREAQRRLEKDPHDQGAFEVIIEATVAKGDHKQALRLAQGWVEQEPDGMQARQQLIRCLALAGNAREARKAAAQYTQDFPYDPEGAMSMGMVVNVLLGDSEKVLKDVKVLREKFGSDPVFDRAEAQAKVRTGRLLGAEAAANRVLEADPTNFRALSIKTMVAFRTCRFATARRLARQMRDLDPSCSPAATEIIRASYAAYFPPFMVAHFFLMILMVVSTRLPMVASFGVSYLLGPFVALPALLAVDALDRMLGIPNFQPYWYGAMAVWLVYMFALFLKFTDRKRQLKPVKLAKAY